jgi:hypothetical protein
MPGSTIMICDGVGSAGGVQAVSSVKLKRPVASQGRFTILPSLLATRLLLPARDSSFEGHQRKSVEWGSENRGRTRASRRGNAPAPEGQLRAAAVPLPAPDNPEQPNIRMRGYLGCGMSVLTRAALRLQPRLVDGVTHEARLSFVAQVPNLWPEAGTVVDQLFRLAPALDQRVAPARAGQAVLDRRRTPRARPPRAAPSAWPGLLVACDVGAPASLVTWERRRRGIGHPMVTAARIHRA